MSNTDGYIKKSTVLARCEDLWNKADETTQTGVDTINAIDTITDFIESAPAEDARPVIHAEWINEFLDDDDVWWAECSNCKDETHSRYGKVSTYRYCPNCGAKMLNE